jgi:hypothetical protein
MPSEAFDAQGKILPEYLTTVVRRAYPEGHSVWDKIECPAHLTLKEFGKWLADTHKLQLVSKNDQYLDHCI